MTYDEIAELCKQLGYRDKLRLAQLLIQLARKEEENQNAQKPLEKNQEHSPIDKNIAEIVQYVLERIQKLKPSKKSALLNSINTMFQFQGGISDSEKEKIVSELQRLKHIQIDKNNRVTYL